MAFIDLFPTVIFKEKLNNILSHPNEFYKEKLTSLSYRNLGPNGSSSLNQKVLELDIFNNLKNSIINYSKQYLNSLNHYYEDIQIASSWSNLLHQNQIINDHAHKNSYISGVFYFDYSSPITFINPLLPQWSFVGKPTQPQLENPRSHYDFSINPEPNLLIIFPSWLIHRVLPSPKNNRLSIAFNIIPKGEFGPESARLYL